MAKAPLQGRDGRRHQLVVSAICAVAVFSPMGCSLFDWGDNEMPAGYRASLPPAKQAKLAASDRGQAYLQDNRLGLAIDAYLNALILEGRTIETLNGLGVAYDLLGRFDLSRQYYREALSVDSQSVRTLNNLGRSYALEQNYVEAIRYYELAMSFDSVHEVVRSNLVEARAMAQRPPRMNAEASDPNGIRSDEPRLPWLQHAGLGVQTLVTHADSELIDALRKTDVKPQLAAPVALVFDDGRSDAAAPTVSPARHARVVPKADGAAATEHAAATKAAARAGIGKLAAYVPVAITIPAASVADIASPDSPPVVKVAAALSSEAVASTEIVGRGASRYRLQLVAMRKNDDAERVIRALRDTQGDILDRLELTIERADLGPERGVFYRVQTGPVGSAADARNLCRSFVQRRQDCFLVRI